MSSATLEFSDGTDPSHPFHPLFLEYERFARAHLVSTLHLPRQQAQAPW